VHLLRDQGLLVQEEGSWRLRSGAEVPLPDSIQALIAARLDTLSAERKSMLADAAVVGKVFWAGAVAEMGRRDVGEVAEAMHELSHKELVRPARRSSMEGMEGEAEYAFWHVLARDVAYAQLPRSSRSVRHVAPATWLEAKAGERVEDIAEVLAHHYATALELALAAGDTERATELEAPALRFLALVGERALNLDVATAVGDVERALALAPLGHPARPELQMQMAEALDALNRVSEAVELAEQAIAAFDARGDDYRSGRAMVRLSAKLGNMGQLEKPRELAGTALKRLEPLGPSEALVLALEQVSFLADYGDPRKTEYEDRALAMAEEFGLAEPRIRVLAVRGLRRVNEGDEGGMDDMRTALAAALEAGASSHAASLYDWLVFWLTISDGHAAASVQADKGIEFARRRGMRGWVNGIRGDRVAASFAAGAWSEVLSEAEDLIEESRAGGQFSTVFDASIYKVAVVSLRGHVEEAGELARGFLERESGPLDPTFNFVGPRIRGLRSEGAEEAAIALLDEWVGLIEADDPSRTPYFRLQMAREAIALGRIDLARRCAAVPTISWAVQASAEGAALQAVID
jgi:tetratricopeptide (TPR) repeat protein